MEEKLKLYRRLADNALHALNLQSAIFAFYINCNSKDEESKQEVLKEIHKTQSQCAKWIKELNEVERTQSNTLLDQI